MDFEAVYNIILTGGMGVIGFFLKHFFDKLNDCASKTQVRELQSKLDRADEKYAGKSELDELKKSIEKMERNIDFLKENTVRNNDFVHRVLEAVREMDDDALKNSDPLKLIDRCTALIRAVSHKSESDVRVKNLKDVAFESFKEDIFSAMAKEAPELYKQIVQFINAKREEDS